MRKIAQKKKTQMGLVKEFQTVSIRIKFTIFPSISFLYSIVQRIEIIKIQHLFPLTVEIFNGLYVQKCWNMAQTLSSIFLLFPTISTVKKSCTKIMNNLHVSIAMWLIWFSLTSTLAHYYIFFYYQNIHEWLIFLFPKKKKKPPTIMLRWFIVQNWKKINCQEYKFLILHYITLQMYSAYRIHWIMNRMTLLFPGS